MTQKKELRALEDRNEDDDGRLFSPSVAKNLGPISAVLDQILNPQMKVFEIASGTGEHAAAMVDLIDDLVWQPSDIDADARKSIEAWRQYLGNSGLLPPLDLDVIRQDWTQFDHNSFDAVVCINMIHISPWPATMGVLEGAAHLLGPKGWLFFYGPFKRNGRHTAGSNQDFDHSLRQKNPEWGVRDADEIGRLAADLGLAFQEIVEMPNNNLVLKLRKIVTY